MLRWNSVLNVARCSLRCAYTTASVSPENAKVAEDLGDLDKRKVPQTDRRSSEQQTQLVAAAFASLRQINTLKASQSPRASRLLKTLKPGDDVDSVLAVADQPSLSKNLALQVCIHCFIRQSESS